MGNLRLHFIFTLLLILCNSSCFCKTFNFFNENKLKNELLNNIPIISEKASSATDKSFSNLFSFDPLSLFIQKDKRFLTNLEETPNEETNDTNTSNNPSGPEKNSSETEPNPGGANAPNDSRKNTTEENNNQESGASSCYKTCSTCKEVGNEDSHNCLTCQENYYMVEGNCLDSCPEGYITSGQMCTTCSSGMEAKNNRCSLQFTSDSNDSSFSKVSQSKGEMKEQIDDNILDCLNQNKTIRGDDYSFQVAFSNTSNTNTSQPSLNISACEALLRDKNDIPSNESLIILTMELERENSRTNQVEYSVYTEDGEKLDLSVCENITVAVSYPLTNTTGINFDKGQELHEKGYDIYDPTDNFYNDICSSYSVDGVDVPLKDRRNDFYKNVSFCESGCTYQGINYTSNNVKCDCSVKTEISTDEAEDETSTESFTDSVFSVNIMVVKCLKETLKWNSLQYNIGFWFTMVCLILIILLLLYVVIFEYKGLHSRILSEIKINSPPPFCEKNFVIIHHQMKNANNFDLVTENDIATIEKMSSTSEDNIFSSNFKNLILLLTKNREIDELPFELAVETDKRKILYQFLDVYKDKEPFLRSLFTQSKTELIGSNLSVYIFCLSLDFTLNALFFTDDVMSKRYNGELGFLSNILRSIYSCIVGSILQSIMQSFSKYYPLIDSLILDGKNHERTLILVKHFFFYLKRKIIILFTAEILCLLFFWYYTAAFCAVYSGSQIEWFKGGWTSFLISLVTSFFISISLSGLRTLALFYKSRNVYNASLFIKNKI